MKAHALLLAALAWLPLNLSATPAGVVASTQDQVWIERGGNKLPASTGMTVEGGDKVATGANSRLLIKLKEGSDLRLGPDASMSVGDIFLPDDTGGYFIGSFNLSQGAVRFSTTAESESFQREIELRVGDVSAGVQTTDLWGRATPEGDTLVLVDGTVKILSGKGEPVELLKSGSVFYKPKGGSPAPVTMADRAQLTQWLAETDTAVSVAATPPPAAIPAAETPAGPPKAEPAAAKAPVAPAKPVEKPEPVASGPAPTPPTGGAWALSLQSTHNPGYAGAAASKLHDEGIGAVVKEVEVHGDTWYRVVVEGFASHAEAMVYATQIRDRSAAAQAWAFRE